MATKKNSMEDYDRWGTPKGILKPVTPAKKTKATTTAKKKPATKKK
ncbi:MAG: hypothetical protein PHS82_02940 [Lachnospiraceae bacterium]|nr:hypothetical protein [Lachnospiraceae bacterium]